MDSAELIRKVRKIEIKTGRLVSETFAGEYKSVFKGRGMEFAEVREYVAGDDIRSIDWNVSARSGKTYIKRFIEERELTVMIVCDISASNLFGSKASLKKDAAAEISALFAFSALTNNDRVGLMLFSDQVELYIPPRKGRKHVLRIVRDMLAFEPKRRGTDISMALNTINRIMKRQGIVVLVSDFLNEGFEKAVKLSDRKFDLIPVVVTDSLEREIPSLPVIMEVQDPESGEAGMLDLSHGIDNGAARLDVDRAVDLFDSLGLDYITADTESELADSLVRFFKKREKRKSA
ncbi:Protein of unknown function DUF58 [Parelusimicrobium proximum]|uniref:DUF58 domain-containing protein n=1 Tax=Parelusimicrobium proximum TaxID=3228953 RepID=UPI003D1632B0